MILMLRTDTESDNYVLLRKVSIEETKHLTSKSMNCTFDSGYETLPYEEVSVYQYYLVDIERYLSEHEDIDMIDSYKQYMRDHEIDKLL